MTAAGKPKVAYKRIRTAMPLTFGFTRSPRVLIGPNDILVVQQRLFSERTLRLHFADIEMVAVRPDGSTGMAVATNLLVATVAAAMGAWLISSTSEINYPAPVIVGIIWSGLAAVMFLKAVIILFAGGSKVLTLCTATQSIEMKLGARYIDRLLNRELLPLLAVAQNVSGDSAPTADRIATGKIAPASRRIVETERRPISPRFIEVYFCVSILLDASMFATRFFSHNEAVDMAWMVLGSVMMAWVLFVIVHVFRRRASPAFRGTFVLYLWLVSLSIFWSLSMRPLGTPPPVISGSFAASSPSELIPGILGYVVVTLVNAFLLAQLRSYRNSYWAGREFVSHAPLKETP